MPILLDETLSGTASIKSLIILDLFCVFFDKDTSLIQHVHEISTDRYMM